LLGIKINTFFNVYFYRPYKIPFLEPAQVLDISLCFDVVVKVVYIPPSPRVLGALTNGGFLAPHHRQKQGIYTLLLASNLPIFEKKKVPPTRLQLAKSKLNAFLDQTQKRVLSRLDLQQILSQNRSTFQLARSTTLNAFIDFLLNETKLKEVALETDMYSLPARYTWRDVSPHLLALSFRKAGYLTHATALVLNALTVDTSTIVYVNFEQSPKKRSGQLSQESIDRAFSNPQRRTWYVFNYGDGQIAILSGKHTNRLGVITKQTPSGESLDLTGIERTLVDVTVRPDYSGGVRQVLEAYNSARHLISVDLLLEILKGMDYTYPYHQAVGFCMQRAGYDESSWTKLKHAGSRYDFYLAHGMSAKKYNSEWRIFYPAEIDQQ